MRDSIDEAVTHTVAPFPRGMAGDIMQDFIQFVVEALVDHPEEVVIEEFREDGGVVYELQCHPDDVGKVIGRNGRTITAIRTLISNAAAGKGQARVSLEIVE